MVSDAHAYTTRMVIYACGQKKEMKKEIGEKETRYVSVSKVQGLNS
jgi:hypothetical protein